MSALTELNAARKAATEGDAREASYRAYRAGKTVRSQGAPCTPRAKNLSELANAFRQLTMDALDECLENLEEGPIAPVEAAEQYASSWHAAARVAQQVADKGYVTPGWSEPANEQHARAIWALIPTPTLTPIEVTPGRVIAEMLRVMGHSTGANVTRTGGVATVDGVSFTCPATWDGARELAHRVDQRHPNTWTELMRIDSRAALFHDSNYAIAQGRAYHVIRPTVSGGRMCVLLRPLDGTRRVAHPADKVRTCRATAA